MGKMVRALTGFVKRYGDEDVLVKSGDVFDSEHELVRGTPEDWWAPLEARFQVEQATASPGETRKATVRTKSSPQPSDAADD
jgi:hypothetical protein